MDGDWQITLAKELREANYPVVECSVQYHHVLLVCTLMTVNVK